MLTGPELGAAIESAVAKKGISKQKLAEDFGVKPPSVQGWIKTGRIDKAKFFGLLTYFSDVVDATHWGLPADYNAALTSGEAPPAPVPQRVEEDSKAKAAALVLTMLEKHASKGMSSAAREKISQAVAESLAEQHVVPSKPSNVITADFSRGARMKDGDIFIPQYDVRGSMGDGQIVADYVEFVRNIVVSGVQLERLGVDYTSPENLSIITGWGHSMTPTINDKDPVLVDRGVRDFIGEGIYVVIWQEHLYIKRLQMFDADQIELISDNKKHKDRVVPLEDVTVQAKVVYIWNGTKA